ncbi:LANO_0H10704g1_1 [Lachancea nothofagi CBS 11611]|uniref:Protein transport protein SEC23 n=1 Tax=Lachancea nothofagi CBS 11611 TaxID=1266666 RepID=A0A1G4KM74_9SACH|nr:LANO_0H10704g1_1 [Lachancea nothofagi CBS 11611]
MIGPTFEVIPTSRLESELQLPYLHEPGHVDVLYETNDHIDETRAKPVFQACLSCGAAIIDNCAVIQDQWICPFCQNHNPLVQKPVATPYEVELPNTSDSFEASDIHTVLIIDLCTHNKLELESLQRVLISRLERCRSEAKFGLITLRPDGNVTLHSDSSEICFSGNDVSTVTKAKNLDYQYFLSKLAKTSPLCIAKKRAMDVVGQLSFSENKAKDQRPKRALGLSFLLAGLYPSADDFKVPVTAFITGPCTVGPGKVVAKNKKFYMRQHHDLDAGRDKYFRSARRLFEHLSEKVTVHLMIASLDQIGVVEMAPMCERIQQFDSYEEKRFQDLVPVFSLAQDHVNEITVFASKGLLVDGCYGPVSKLKPSQQIYSDTPCGVSGTNRWLSHTATSSLAFSFQINTSATKEETLDVVPAHLAIQFQHTFYKCGKKYLKVGCLVLSTTNKNLSDPRSIPKSFNVSIALPCLMKQIAYDQLMKGHIHAIDLQQWQNKIDRLAARHLKAMSRNHSKFLELLYRLKWTTLLQKRNTSPDEAACFQHTILFENATIAELLCKPRVMVFTEDIKLEVTALNERLLQRNEAMCVDFGTLILLRYLNDDPALSKAEEYAHSLIAARTSPVRIEKTFLKGSQDRFFISKLIPDREINSEDTSLCEYTGTIRKMAQCLHV